MSTTIKLKNLFFRYPNTLNDILRDVTVSIDSGEKVAIVGSNGAGKSTLLLQLNGLLQCRGEIHVGNTILTKKTIKEVRRRIGLVFQDPDDQLFMPTVEEDISFGLLYQDMNEQDIIEKTLKVLEDLEISELAHRAPYHLSGGEKRLVALATVLVMDPDVLVLDEPTAGLDPKARRQLINILRGRKETQIIATHDLEFAVETADRVLVLYYGEIVADGDIRIILAEDSLMKSCDLEVPHILHIGPHIHNK